MNPFQKAFQAFKQKAVGSKERVEGAILPSVTKAVVDCINNRWKLSIYYYPYEGVKKVKPEYYTILPLMYGLNKYTKNHIIRAWVYSGGDFFGFVTFRLDRMRQAKPLTGNTVDKAPDGYNKASDGLMSEILLKIQFPK